jgi:hypothetical protein
VQTKTERSYPSELLEEIIKINLRCLAMNPKDHILIDKAFHRMKDLVFSLLDTKDKEGNPITSIYKIAGESELKLSTEHAQKQILLFNSKETKISERTFIKKVKI